MKKLLVLGYASSEKYIIQAWDHNFPCTYEFHSFEDIRDQGIKKYLLTISRHFDGVASISERTSLIAALVESHLFGKNVPDYLIRCQNKYISRLKQREYISNHIPIFCLSTDHKELKNFSFPVFVKPIHGSLSFCADRVLSMKELDAFIQKNEERVHQHNIPYSLILDESGLEHPFRDTYNDFIVESVLTGKQITVDGYVFENKIVFFGITEATMHSNCISFMRWDYPASLSAIFYKKIYDVVRKLIIGFDLNNTLFNVECMVNEQSGKVNIIEVHSRVSIQFAPLIEKVTGYNSIWAMRDIALGIDPQFEHKNKVGMYKYSSSCVLRKMNDCKVIRVPTSEELSIIEQKHDVKITPLVYAGRHLSHYHQDSKTFRYGLISVSGESVDEIAQKFERIKKELSYVFRNV